MHFWVLLVSGIMPQIFQAVLFFKLADNQWMMIFAAISIET